MTNYAPILDTDTTVTPAMRHANIRSVQDERAHAAACAWSRWPGDPYPDALVIYRVARHRARIAWAEVAYAAHQASAGFAIGRTSRFEAVAERLPGLIAAATAAGEIAREAHVAFRRVEDALPPRKAS